MGPCSLRIKVQAQGSPLSPYSSYQYKLLLAVVLRPPPQLYILLSVYFVCVLSLGMSFTHLTTSLQTQASLKPSSASPSHFSVYFQLESLSLICLSLLFCLSFKEATISFV